MVGVQRKGLLLQIAASWGVPECILDSSASSLLFVAGTNTEVWGFVHVLPKTVKCYTILEITQLFSPPLVSILSEEIWEHCIIWPYLACEIWSALVSLDEDVSAFTWIVCGVVSSISLSNTSIDNWNEMLSLGMKALVHKGRQVLPFTLIDFEVPVISHVINISPLSI